jgi:Nucleotidyl transferase AbiEii toxin, Type IV TA system
MRQQRLREVAYRRLLARLFETQPDRWVVKGGAALLLRLDPNRTSNDIDLAYVVEAGEHGAALEALAEAAAYDAGDFFEFEVADDPVVDGTARVALLALPAQVADKTCAVFELHGPNRHPSSRARDLADIAMIATQKDFDGDELTSHVRREERHRLDAGTLAEPLPAALRLSAEQLADWRLRWRRATRGAPIEFDDALVIAARFMDPVLEGAAAGRTWNGSGQQWE